MFSDLKINSPNDISFKIKDIDISIINALRRIILSEVPNVGFYFDPNDHDNTSNSIDIITNDTPLHNEFLMHRIGLIPICLSKDEIDNWNNLYYTFKIDVTNDTGKLLNVTTNDIKVFDHENKFLPEVTKRYFPYDSITKDYILITKLNKKQNSKLEISAKAIVSNPQLSASFGMVSKCAVEFIIDENVAKKELSKLLQDVPEEEKEIVTKNFNTLNKERCYHKNKYKEPSFFKMSIVSECNISSLEIVSMALNILLEKFKKLKTEKAFDIHLHNELMVVSIPNETHTIGNSLQSMCFNNFIREANDKDNIKLTYIGYNVPHPLEAMLNIKFKGDNIYSIYDAENCFEMFLDYCLSQIQSILKEWNTFSN